MSEFMTFAERAEEDHIVLRPVLVGVRETIDHEEVASVWSYIFFDRSNEAYDREHQKRRYLHLNDKGLQDEFDGQWGETIPEDQWNANAATFYGTTLVVGGTFEQYIKRDDQGLLVPPTVATALNEVCRIAADIENYPDFYDWLTANRSETEEEPLSYYKAKRAAFEQDRVIHRQLRDFLGTKFDDYINHTEWE